MDCVAAAPRSVERVPRSDTVDTLLTVAGWGGVGLLVLALFTLPLRSFAPKTAVGGPLTVFGPLRVRGNLYVGGPVTVHGPVQARKMTIGGPITPRLPRGEKPGPDPKVIDGPMAIGGPLTVYGSLVVEGRLVAGGPIISEPSPQS